MNPVLSHVAKGSPERPYYALITTRAGPRIASGILRETVEEYVRKHPGLTCSTAPAVSEHGSAALSHRVRGTKWSLQLFDKIPESEFGMVQVEPSANSEYEVPSDVRDDLISRFRDRVEARASLPPEDGRCHVLGFGRECDRIRDHSGDHIAFLGENPAGWDADGNYEREFHARLLVPEIYRELLALEKRLRDVEGRLQD